MGSPGDNPDRKIAGLAGQDWGVVSHAELVAAGVTPRQVYGRRASGVLHDWHRGVYLVGNPRPTPEARYLAAVKACGSGAVLSGPAAGWLLGIVKGRPPMPEVSTPKRRTVRGIRTRRRSGLESFRWRGIPVTNVPQTLVDLASSLSPDELARSCHEAGVRFDTTPGQVARILGRRPTAPGAAELRRVMTGETKVALSKLEALARDAFGQLEAMPDMNRSADGRRVDCRWPRHRLTVELDSYRFHNSRYAWKQDRKREREAYARGDDFRRYDWDDVVPDPSVMLRELAGLLRLAARPTS